LNPACWKSAALMALKRIGDPGPLRDFSRVSGGSIGRAFRLVTDRNAYFFKGHEEAPSGFFAAEAQGLRRLGEAAKTVRVPHVFQWDGPDKGGTGWILMEWIASDPRGPSFRGSAEKLGRGLAEIHRTTAEAFGLEEDNFIGILPQPNGWYPSWTDFYRERRLLPQIRLASEQGLLPERRSRLLHRLCERLEQWLERPGLRPSLLHGDLWNGNALTDSGGTPCLIDPAVYFGDREVDLAFSEMFGGFPDPFYDAYNEAFPLPPEFSDRKPLYQLYHLLVHLNLFGEAYGAAVDRIAERYAG
jgi:fructosamine-3-kinase